MYVRSQMELEKWSIFLAAICGQTYEQFSNPDGSFVVPPNYSVRDTIEAKSIINEWEPFGFILESANDIIVAFRGTSTATNWISDIIATQRKFKYVKENCLTHRGFTDIYYSARSRIMSTLAKLPSDKTLFVTGHSLGAALATLCAIDIGANSEFASPYLFTYGGPRVGDPAFSKAFAKYVPSSHRIANEFDVITHAPPSIYKLPKSQKRYYYSHVPTVFTLNFQNGSFGGNHVISSYFAALSKLQPQYAQLLCSANPGFCPVGGSEKDE